jgi:hypothetical protein
MTPASLSPGRVHVHKNLRRTPSTVSSGYQYRISSCSISPSPTHKLSTTLKLNSPEIDPTFFCQGSTQPPSRNSAYSPAESPTVQTRQPSAQNQDPSGLPTQTNAHTSEESEELSRNAETYIDQLEKENQQLKNLLLNQMPTSEDVSQGYNSMICSTTSNTKHLGKQSQKENPNPDYNLCSVPDLVKNIPQQLSNNLVRNIPQQMSSNNLGKNIPHQSHPKHSHPNN